MTLKEFREQDEHAIVRNHVQFNFYKVRDYMWLLEITIATLPQETEEGTHYDHSEAQTTLTSVEAYYAYKNILDGGLD